jgi:uncharacterized protein
MENKFQLKSLILGLSLFLGLSVLGFFIFRGLKTFSDRDRVVTVKGLAEMDMTATTSAISITFSFSGDNLKELIKKAESKKSNILNYLKNSGFDTKDLSEKNIDISDRQKYYEIEWQDGKQIKTKVDRYAASQTIMIKCKDVKTTDDKLEKIELDLISKDLTSNIESLYTFPDLNTIKPKLIAESTKNARISGEQFANDSKAKLGKIKTASQGQISIVGDYQTEEETTLADSDSPEPFIRRARVVSTIVFFLE